YCLHEAALEAAGGPEALAEHFKSVRRALGAKTRDTILVTSMEDSTLRNVEVPPMELAQLREMFKLNARHFFQQDMPGFVFDCFTPLTNGAHDPAKNGKLANVLVGTVKGEF